MRPLKSNKKVIPKIGRLLISQKVWEKGGNI